MIYLEPFESRRFLHAGQLDPSFGTGGIATLNLSQSADGVASLVETADGGAVVSLIRGEERLPAFVRRDGLASFGQDGTATSPLPDGSLVAVSDGGRAAFADTFDGATGSDLQTGILHADGSTDTSYGTNCIASSFREGDVSDFHGVFDADGNLLLVGGSDNDTGFTPPDEIHGSADLIRFAPDGSSKRVYQGAVDSYKVAIGRSPEGQVLFATGTWALTDGTRGRLQIVRANPDGSVDETFGGADGITVAQVGGVGFFSSAVVSQGSDGVVTVFVGVSHGQTQYFLYRFSRTGQPLGAPVEVSLPERLFPFAIEDDGKLLLAGPASDDSQWLARRLNIDGSIDSTFGDDGTTVIAVSPNSSFTAADAAPDGTIMLAGTGPAAGGGSAPVLMRLEGNGPQVRLKRSGTLLVGGTTGDDVIQIYRRASDRRFVVRANGVTRTFAPHAVHTVTVRGYGGDDTILIGGGIRRAFLDGGAGRDTLTGGAGNDVILGGAGNDSIFGGTGADKIFGGEGNDAIAAGGGNDYVLGGAQNDSIEGNGGFDTLSGAGGQDLLHGGGPEIDHLLGGAGTDTATRDPNDVINSVENLLEPVS